MLLHSVRTSPVFSPVTSTLWRPGRSSKRLLLTSLPSIFATFVETPESPPSSTFIWSPDVMSTATSSALRLGPLYVAVVHAAPDTTAVSARARPIPLFLESMCFPTSRRCCSQCEPYHAQIFANQPKRGWRSGTSQEPESVRSRAASLAERKEQSSRASPPK